MMMTNVVLIRIEHAHDNDGCGSLIDKAQHDNDTCGFPYATPPIEPKHNNGTCDYLIDDLTNIEKKNSQDHMVLILDYMINRKRTRH